MGPLKKILILAVFPISLLAQGRSGGVAAGHAPVAAPRAAAPAPAARAAAPAAPNGMAHGTLRPVGHASPGGRVTGTHIPRSRALQNGMAGYGAQSADYYPVPGLGFDMTHVAATRGPRGAGFHHREGRGGRGSIYGAGGYMFYPLTGYLDEGGIADAGTEGEGVEDREYPQEQAAGPGVVSDYPEQDAAYVMDRQREVGRRGTAESVGAAPAAPEPARDMEQYVFVKRDGTLQFAVGYSWEHGTLWYVTKEGVRHSLGRDALDLDATQQFNEQRGLNFKAPVA